MKLIHNWSDVLRRAWSVRLLLIAGLFSAAEIALPLVREICPIPTGLFAALSGIATFGALVARLLAQRSIGERK